MKRTKLTALVLVSVMLMSIIGNYVVSADSGAKAVDFSKFNASMFPTWFEEEGVWRTLSNAVGDDAGGFVTEATGKPSNEDLEKMLHMASLAVTSGGRTDWYMVAVTDTEEQKAIIGEKYGVAASEGTATILVFSERLLRTDVRSDENALYQPDRGYYNTGIVTGYLNIAAISMGYGTHFFMSPALPGTNGFNNGERGLEVDKYLKGTTYTNGLNHETFSNDNMKFVCAVVIGTPAEGVPESGVTTHDFPDNWSFWTK